MEYRRSRRRARAVLLTFDAMEERVLCSITVPATANPYLADPANATGPQEATDGTVPPSIDVTNDSLLTFSVTGGATNNLGVRPIEPPDGGALVSSYYGARGAISSWNLPISALAGVFLGTKLGPAPAAYTGSLSALNISPPLGQVFYIGDGLTGTGTGVTQDFHVPAGATKLFLVDVDGFMWSDNGGQFNVTASSVGASIAVNNTLSTNDNITLLNTASTGEPYMQTIPATITNTGDATTTYQLIDGFTGVFMTPPGLVSLSQASVTLDPGKSTIITITPLVDSSVVNDVHILAVAGSSQVAEDDMTVVSVVIPQHVRASDTPASMSQDRIPPSGPSGYVGDTQESAVISPDLTGSGQAITLAVDGQTANNGTTSIDGNPTEDLTTSKIVNIKGITQTAPTGSFSDNTNQATAMGVGLNANNLKLTVRVDGTDTVQSIGFSVAAIPINIITDYLATIGLPGTKSAGQRGFSVDFRYSSDSGNSADLDSVDISEQVQYSASNGGVFSGITPPNNSNYKAAVLAFGYARGDIHNVLATDIQAPGGTETADQTFTFRDLRTGANNIVIPDAGFVITYIVYPTNSGWLLNATEVGQLATANGFTSSAGRLNGNSNNGSKISVTLGP